MKSENFASMLDKIEVPDYIKKNCERGLELNRQGHGGDGLTDQTKQEAREMAKGEITYDKCKRMAAWFARHREASITEGFNPRSPKYPSAGLVAWLLWGGDGTGSMRAAVWAEEQVNRIDKEREKNKK